MKRSSEGTETGKEIGDSSPSKKQSKGSSKKLGGTSGNSRQSLDSLVQRQMQHSGTSIDRRARLVTGPALGSYHQGVPHSLVNHRSAYANTLLTQGMMPHGPSPASAGMPYLLANLPMHHQQSPRPLLSFPLSQSAASADAESLAQFILASQLSRGLAGNAISRSEQLNLFRIANSIQQQQQRATNHSSQALVDRLLHYRGATMQGMPSDTRNGIISSPMLAASGGGSDTLSNTSVGLANPSLTSSQDSTRGGSLPLSLSTDRSNLSEYQCLIREQIDLFAATQTDIDSSAQGRNRPIVVQQVGIRCRHCAALASSRRSRGAVYYPAKLSGLYQAAQNMTLNHFTTTCQSLPQDLREEILRLKQRKSYVLGGGKGYWARGGQIRNIIEIDDRLFFRDQVPDSMKARMVPEERTSGNKL